MNHVLDFCKYNEGTKMLVAKGIFLKTKLLQIKWKICLFDERYFIYTNIWTDQIIYTCDDTDN